MIVFAVGIWVGAALGACLMGALWARERRGQEVWSPVIEVPAVPRLAVRARRARAAGLH